MLIQDVDKLIRAVCPIDGLNAAGEIFFDPSATPEQRDAAIAVFNANPIDGIDTVALDLESAKITAKADATVLYLINHTPNECFTKVKTDVDAAAIVTQADAKAAIIKLETFVARLAMAVCVLSKHHLK
jgi:hypothetical protein